MGMVKIKPIGKGSVPLHLRGDYTSYAFAKKAVDAHKAEKPTNAKAKSN